MRSAVILITVAFGSMASSQDIRDIRGPKAIYPHSLMSVAIAAGVLLALAAFGAWRWRRRRRHPEVLLPFELALRRLEESRALMQPARATEFSVAVSDIIRGYIELQFEVTATRRTTEEFLRDLLGSPGSSLASHRDLLSDFLHQCDWVKFAGMSLTAQNMESLYQSACTFVRETVRNPSIEPHDSIPAT